MSGDLPCGPSKTSSWEARSRTRTWCPISRAGTEYWHCRTVTRAYRSTRGVSVSPVSNASAGQRRAAAAARAAKSCPTVWRPVADPAVVVLGVVARRGSSLSSAMVSTSGHRDQVGAAEPAALTLDAALLVRALDAGLAVERVEAVVGPEQRPTGRTRSGSRPNNTRDTAAFRLS